MAAMEGKFSGEGLQAIDEPDDLLMAMARELVNEESIGQSADAVWRDLRRQQEQPPPGGASAPEKLRVAFPADPFSEETLAKEPGPFPATALGARPVTHTKLQS